MIADAQLVSDPSPNGGLVFDAPRDRATLVDCFLYLRNNEI